MLRKNSRRRTRRLRIESLESRRVLAATPQLVFDSNTSPVDSNPSHLTPVGSSVVFFADQDFGRGLFVSDGTEAGTRVLVANSIETYLGSWIASLGNLAVFPYSTPAAGLELWATDGSEAGTTILKDIVPSDELSFQEFVAVAGNHLYFTVDDGVHGRELWVTDGTSDGTELVADMTPGDSGTTIGKGIALGSDLIFVATTAEHGSEFWRTDGTATGTILLEVASGPTSSSPANLTVFQNKVYFTAFEPSTGVELWSTDGTPDGTSLVKDVYPGGLVDISTGQQVSAFSSDPSDLSVYRNKLYFRATNSGQASVGNRQLFESDGTPDGTVAASLSAVPSEVQFAGSSYSLTRSGLSINTLTRWNNGNETTVFRAPEFGEKLSSLTAAGDALYFLLIGSNEVALWRSDGTTAGTRQVSSTVRDISSITAANNNVYFAATTPETGNELWALSVGASMAALVKDVTPSSQSTSLSNVTVIGNRIYFARPNGPFVEDTIWVSDGTPEGSRPVNPDAVNDFDDVIVGSLDDDLIFTSQNHGGDFGGSTFVLNKLAADGTVRELVNFVDRPSDFEILSYGTSAHAGRIYFFATDSRDGLQLWTSDGTSFGTRAVHSFGLQAFVDFAAAGQDRLYFAVQQRNPSRLSLRTSDGTASGTTELEQYAATTSIRGYSKVIGDELYFGLHDSVDGLSVWHSDGTLAGTGLLKALAAEPDPAGSFFTFSFLDFAPLGDRVAFTFSHGASEKHELWITDGSAAETELFSTLATSYQDFFNYGIPFGSLGDRVVFGFVNEQDKLELRITDGTAAGTTTLLDDIVGSYDTDYQEVGDLLYFQHATPETGAELWRTDGTPAGTQIADDVRPGGESSDPFNFQVSGDRLLFLANDGQHGYEFWSLVDSSPNVHFVESSLAVTEEAAAVTIEVELSTAEPLANDLTVTIQNSLRLASASDYSLSASTIIFPAGSIDGTRRSLTISALADDWVEGDEQVVLQLASQDAAVHGSTTPLFVTLKDADLASVRFETERGAATERQSPAMANVVLEITPAGSRLERPAQVLASTPYFYAVLMKPTTSQTITFPAGSGTGARQSVEITFEDNDDQNFDDEIQLNLATSTDNVTLPIAEGATYTLSILDDDGAGIVAYVVGRAMVSEQGREASIAVRLRTIPTAPVTVFVSSDDESEGRVSVSQLTFLPENADQPQFVTITGVDDSELDLDTFFTISFTTESADELYEGLQARSVSLTNLDDDLAPFRNELRASDVNNDGHVSPLDVLLIINELNRAGSRALTQPRQTNDSFWDVNGDKQISPLDVLLVINLLNAVNGESERLLSAAAEGEGQLARDAVFANDQHFWAALDDVVYNTSRPDRVKSSICVA